MTDLQTAQQHWKDTLAQLQLQMPRATFDTWVKDTCLVAAEDGHYTIATKSAYAQDWLQNRLFDTIRRSLAHITGRSDIQLTIIVEESPPSDTPAPEAIVSASEGGAIDNQAEQPGAPPGSVTSPATEATEAEIKFVSTTSFYRLKMDMGFWLPEFPYDQTFWFRHWKRGAYFLRRRLESHWLERYAKKEQRDLEDPANHWTSAFRVRYREMARWLGLKKAELISGGEVECHKCYLARLKEKPLTTCCGDHPFHDWRQAEDGSFHCYYWRPGMLHRLYDEQAITIEIIKPSDQPRAHQVWLQVWRVLPFLTPAQMGTHDPLTGKEHEVWMQRFGQDRFGLSLNQWEEFQADKHIPLMPGHQEGQKLHGEPEANPFAPAGHTNEGSSNDSTTPLDLPDEDEDGEER